MARLFAGLPVARTLTDIVGSFANASKRELTAAGLIIDSANQVLHREARWAGGMQGPGWSQVLADRNIAWSGLAAWTQAGKHGFGLAFMAELGSRADLDFAALPGALRRSMERYGLTAADWDDIRTSMADLHLLRPSDVEAAMVQRGQADRRVAERYLEMILQETEYAVPSGTLQAKARAYGGLKRGVLRDEVFRSMGQFKMFGITVAMLQSQRIASEIIQGNAWRGAGYAAGLLITSTLLGALAMQLKETAKGKDTRPMVGADAPKFWAGALLQGGGLGIYGDFLSAETNRFGGGLARTVLGPTGDVAASVLSLTSGNVAQYIRGEKTNTGREVVRFLGGNTPGGSLWYLRLAYERRVLDELQKQVDPEAHAAFRRRIESQRRDFGNEFFWAPGDHGWSRGPNFGRALQGR
jgi:hypothetical protein